jgi:hypothetical protein
MVSLSLTRSSSRLMSARRMMLRRRHQPPPSNSNNNTKRWNSSSDLPPLPSPSKAKKKYLESRPEDIHTKILKMNDELEAVRQTQTKRLEKELHKPWYRKLIDPLRRYKHSVINMGAVTLAYVLAHNLFMARKREKAVIEELKEARTEIEEYKGLIKSVVEPQKLQQIASQCVEKEEPTPSTRKSWFASGRSSNSVDDSKMEEKIYATMQRELGIIVGDVYLPPQERKKKVVEELIEENKHQVKEIAENPELLLKALEEAEVVDDEKEGKVKKRVFSL